MLIMQLKFKQIFTDVFALKLTFSVLDLKYSSLFIALHLTLPQSDQQDLYIHDISASKTGLK